MKLKSRSIHVLRNRLKTPLDFFQEAVRYYHNARQTLINVEIRYDRYQDVKPVQEAAAIAYLAILFALDGYLLKQGVEKQKLPRKAESYYHYLTQYSHHNGRLLAHFESAHDCLHAHVYYEGDAFVPSMKEGMKCARDIIQTLTHQNL